MTRTLAALAVAGALVSAYLTWVHYAGIEPICSAVSDCERVQGSKYSELAGIPVAVIGVFGYLDARLAAPAGRGHRAARVRRRGLQRIPHLGGARANAAGPGATSHD